MARRTLGLLALCLACPAPAAAGPADRWNGPIADASARFGIPEEWIRRVISLESGGRTRLNGRPIESPAGAMGLMQLMPGTWRELRDSLGLGADPHDPRDNILAGTAYLRAMYERFGYPGMFAAYNAGPARYSAHLATGRALPAETIAYVAGATGGVFHSAGAGPAEPVLQAPPRSLFALIAGTESVAPAAPEATAEAASSPLFVRIGASAR